MLWSLAFEAVRQEHDEAAKPAPLVFSAGNKLVDDDLGCVPEITELRFPRDECIREVEAIAVFETQDAGFGKRAVLDLDLRLAWLHVFERRVGMAVLVIV